MTAPSTEPRSLNGMHSKHTEIKNDSNTKQHELLLFSFLGCGVATFTFIKDLTFSSYCFNFPAASYDFHPETHNVLYAGVALFDI